VRVARRYRWALRAYPASYRKERGQELLSTLADGDEDRGAPCTREAAALAYRGVLERGRIATSADGLLVIAAALVVFAGFAGLTWAERVWTMGGEMTVLGGDGPGRWAGIALTLSAFAILAAGPFRAVDSPRRRRRAAAIAFVAALFVWSAPGSVFKYSIPDAGVLADFLRWNVAGIFANWSVTIPFAGSVAAGTWLALAALSRLSEPARRRVLAAGLFAAGAVAVALTWARPDTPAPYGQSAFADLGAAVFVTATGMLLALAASLRSARSYPPPSGAPGPR
jgi:hypothetical protein